MTELSRLAEGLLAELSEVLADWNASVPDMSQNFPDWFMYAHVHNIRDLFASIFLLRQEAKIGPMRVLIRVCLESHFNFTAALQHPDFPKNKVHAELRNQKKRIGQSRKLKLADQTSYLDSVEAQTDQMLKLFTENVGAATDNSSWDTMAVAEASKSAANYRTAYFTYSQHVHAVFAVLMDPEGETDQSIDSSLQVVATLMAWVAGLAVNYRNQPDAVARRTRIAHLSIDLAKLTGWQP